MTALARPGQTLLAHSLGVSDLMSKYSPLPKWGALLGLLHDYGKYRPTWVEGMQRINNGETIGRLPHHALEGGLLLLRHQPKAETLAILIASHHTGLPDVSEHKEKLKTELDDHQWMIDQAYTQTLKQQLQQADLGTLGQWLNCTPLQRAQRLRMMYGALILSDRQDAAQWQSPQYDSISALAKRLNDWYQNKYPKPDRGLNLKRWEFYQACREGAKHHPGWLSVRGPCGISKTWSVMQMALDHAALYSKKRVIYCVPWTAILEQSYDQYSEVLGNQNVIGHWSTLIDTDTTESKRIITARQWWDAPIIATTLVQLFNVLLNHTGSAAQRMPALKEAVIVIDEVQGIPNELVETCIALLNQLVQDHGVSIVLSTATMPDYTKLKIAPMECLSDHDYYFSAPELHRVNYEFRTQPWEWDAMADEIKRSGKTSTLIVTNTVAACTDCYQVMQQLEGYTIYRYAADMPPAHRRVVLQQIKATVTNRQKVIVCATSAIETGVQLDCDQGYRENTGIDSIVQFAGRINREGSQDTATVTVFRTAQKYTPPPGAEARCVATSRALALGTDLHSSTVLEQYSRWLSDNAKLDYNYLHNLGHLNWRTVSEKWQMITPTQAVLVDPRLWSQNSAVIAEYDRAVAACNYKILQQHCVGLYSYKYKKSKAAGLITVQDNGLAFWSGSYTEGLGVTTDYDAD